MKNAFLNWIHNHSFVYMIVIFLLTTAAILYTVIPDTMIDIEDKVYHELVKVYNETEDKVFEKLADHLNNSQKIDELQEKDLRFVRAYIRSRLGSDAYIEMAENNCLDSIVYKLAIYDSKWLDGWCANQYRHVESLYKDDLMMYMAYKYDAAQPENLKRAIKLARSE